jgi:ribosomal protein S21
MRVDVTNGNMDQALKRLDRKLKADGLYGELRRREHARSKSQADREKHKRAVTRSRRKLAKAAKLEAAGVYR